jgi:kumamolisin
VLHKAVDLGVKVFAAGGDSGSVGAYPEAGNPLKACVKHPVLQPAPAGVELAVIFPAGSPLVTAVGGTELAIDGHIPQGGSPEGGAVTNEVVWNEPAHPEGTYAGGGGLSSVFAIDTAPWQQAFGLGGMVHRPDIAAMAGSPKYFEGDIGTSGASPMTAGGVAVVDSYLEHHGVTPPGFLNPVLYELARTDYDRVFFDITDGHNDLYQLGCCTAGPGYDLASGLGVPRFDRLAAALPPPG